MSHTQDFTFGHVGQVATTQTVTIQGGQTANVPVHVNPPTSVGTSGQALETDGSNPVNSAWATVGTIGGSNTEVMFNDSGAFGGDAGLTWDKTTQRFNIDSESGGNAIALNVYRLGTIAAAFNSEADIAAGTSEALQVEAGNVGVGEITRLSALRVRGGYNTGGGTVDNNYGVEIEAQGGIGTTNAALHIADQGNVHTDFAIKGDGGRYCFSAPIVPTANNSAGTAGEVAWDATHIYVCVSTNTWVRAATATW